jgi:hypothetical protein
VALITLYAGKAIDSDDLFRFREQMLRVAAIAVASIETLDRSVERSGVDKPEKV